MTACSPLSLFVSERRPAAESEREQPGRISPFLKLCITYVYLQSPYDYLQSSLCPPTVPTVCLPAVPPMTTCSPPMTTCTPRSLFQKGDLLLNVNESSLGKLTHSQAVYHFNYDFNFNNMQSPYVYLQSPYDYLQSSFLVSERGPASESE